MYVGPDQPLNAESSEALPLDNTNEEVRNDGGDFPASGTGLSDDKSDVWHGDTPPASKTGLNDDEHDIPAYTPSSPMCLDSSLLEQPSCLQQTPPLPPNTSSTDPTTEISMAVSSKVPLEQELSEDSRAQHVRKRHIVLKPCICGDIVSEEEKVSKLALSCKVQGCETIWVSFFVLHFANLK